MNTRTQAAPNRSTQTSPWYGWLPLVILPATTIFFRDHMPAWRFMWTLAFTIFAGLK